MNPFGKIGKKTIQNDSKMHLTTIEKKQYDRHLILEDVGLEGQLKLKLAKVLVIGAGGLGCPILQYLTAAGVGRIGIIDDDVVNQSNLQRQILYSYNTIGKNKAATAAKRLKLLNPLIKFDVYKERLSKDNALELFKKYDIIVDGTDNFQSRYLINDAAVLLNKPIVFGSIYKFEGQVTVFNYKNGPTYRCLYPTPPKPNEVPNCSEVGVLGVLPGIIGSLQANEILKIILDLGTILSGKLLTFNTLTMNQLIYSYERNTEISIQSLDQDYLNFCGIPNFIKEISFQEYQKQSLNFNLLDVRTKLERNEYHMESIHIPLNELPQRLHEVPQNKNVLVFCKSGVRSKLAIEVLKRNGFINELVNLKGGLLNMT